MQPARRTLATVVVGLAVLGAPALARADAPAALQQATDRLGDGAPGIIALERKGNKEWHAASGVTDLQTGAPTRADDHYRIGSIPKSFVSTAVLQLVGQGKLSLDDTLEKWLLASTTTS